MASFQQSTKHSITPTTGVAIYIKARQSTRRKEGLGKARRPSEKAGGRKEKQRKKKKKDQGCNTRHKRRYLRRHQKKRNTRRKRG